VIAVGAAADDVEPEVDLCPRQQAAQLPCFLSTAFS
jgi:hypothetical protein